MNLNIKLKTVLIFCLVLLVVLTAIYLTGTRSKQYSNNSSPAYKASKLIEIADSVRNALPDTALAEYNRAISMLQNSGKDKNIIHLIGKSYVGIANIYSEAGDYKLALKNDSIAMEFASQFDDKQIQAKALVIRGTTLFKLSEFDKALICYEKAENQAIEIKDFEIQAKISANRAMIYFYRGNHQKTIVGFTKALNIGKQIKNKMLVAGNYMNLAVVYNSLSKNDSALIYYKFALDLFKQLNDKDGELLCDQNLGNLYYDFADFVKAIDYYELSVKLALEMNNKSNAAKGYHNLAEVYSHIGDNAKATELQFQSIKIKEQLSDKMSLAKGYIGIGTMYYNRNDYAKARTYFEKSLKIFQELKCETEIGMNYSNIANILSAENKRDSAIAYCNEAMEIYRQTGYATGISTLYISLGIEYSLKKDYTLAEKYLIQGLKSKISLNDEEGHAIANHHLANLYLMKASEDIGNSKTDLYQKAEAAGLESYNTAKRLGANPVRRDASEVLKKIYQKQGKYLEALKYSEIFNALSDSLLNKDKIQALTFAEARWNVEKKQQVINNLEDFQKLQQKIIQQKDKEARQHRLIIWIIVALLFLSIVFAVIVVMYIRKRRDAIYQKQVTNITALRMQNTRNTMSPHFFLNVLASLTGLSAQPEQLKEKMKSLALLLRKMIENIDQMAIPLEEELKAVKVYIDLSSGKISETFTVEYQVAEKTNLRQLIPAMIIQIPVENAIKHGLMPLEGEKTLTISVADYADHQHISISDNGIGFKASEGRSTGTGTGLKVLLQTIHLLNANNHQKIEFTVGDRETDDPLVTGTTVSIKIPIEFNYIL